MEVKLILKIRAIYKGEEYRAAQQEKDRYKIYSLYPKEGFEKRILRSKEVVYFKLVNLDELESVFEIREKCEYKGLLFDYYEEKDNSKISIITNDQVFATNTQGFYSPAHGEYWKTVDRREVTFFTEKTLIFPKESAEKKTKNRSELGMLSKIQVSINKLQNETPSVKLTP